MVLALESIPLHLISAAGGWLLLLKKNREFWKQWYSRLTFSHTDFRTILQLVFHFFNITDGYLFIKKLGVAAIVNVIFLITTLT